MKNIKVKPAMILALIYLIIAIPLAAHAVDTARFGIDIYVMLKDDESIDYSVTDYQQNKFICFDTDMKKYVLAEYDTTNTTYRLTGYTDNKEDATQLCAGNNAENPQELKIENLPGGTYEISQISATTEHSMLSNDISVKLSEYHATVDDNEVTIMDDGHIMFRIQLVVNKLPDTPEPEPEWKWALKEALLTTLFIMIPATPIIIFGASRKQ